VAQYNLDSNLKGSVVNAGYGSALNADQYCTNAVPPIDSTTSLSIRVLEGSTTLVTRIHDLVGQLYGPSPSKGGAEAALPQTINEALSRASIRLEEAFQDVNRMADYLGLKF